MPTKIARYRAEAFQKQSGRCYYCGVAMWLNSCAEFAKAYGLDEQQVLKVQGTAEHLIARCDGGSDSAENIVAACLTCNRRRHQFQAPPQPGRYREIVASQLKSKQWHRAWVFARGLIEGSRQPAKG